MALSVNIFFLFSLCFLIQGTVCHKPFLPKAAILPVTKDSRTLLYVTEFFMGENLAPVKSVVDLGGRFLWVDCEDNSVVSLSLELVTSCSLQCSMAADSNSCNSVGGVEKICSVQTENGVSSVTVSGKLHEDRIGVRFWGNETNIGSLASINRFLFSCAPRLLLGDLAEGAKGMLGLGNSRISLPAQFSSTFSVFQRLFALCLSSSMGAVFLGGNPFDSRDQLSVPMIYTPLKSKNGHHYINVKSIKISGKKLSLDPKGFDGGTKISTIVPYTTMESKIYLTFVDAYVKAATNLTLVEPVAPFEACFAANEQGNVKSFPNVSLVPVIDLVLQSELVKWKIEGKNSMVKVSDEIVCLGFLNGGLNQKDPIVLGGHQLEDYILEFNMGNSMLGFSSPLGKKKCSDIESYSSRKFS